MAFMMDVFVFVRNLLRMLTGRADAPQLGR
jgi:hypothetical protein